MVSIIILTYNSGKYIGRLLEGIELFNKGLDYEVIVADNNSDDDTLELVQNYISKVKVIKNTENVGFAKGINIGAKKAKGEYLLFINPDAEWRQGVIDDFVSLFEKDKAIGVIGGKIINRQGGKENSAGHFLKSYQVLVMSLGLDDLFGVRFSPSKLCEVDFVSGGFMAVRKKLFGRLGGFDKNLFMYMEDMEFCFRVKKEGLKVMFEPNVQIVHEGQASSNRGFAVKNIYKGLFYFHKKHGTPFSYFFIRSILILKARTLVALGKIVNNKYLVDTYSQTLKI